MASLSQLPDVVDLSFVAGDTFKIRIRIIDPTTGAPTLLDGYKIAADIKKSYTDPAVIGGFDVLLTDGTLVYDDTSPSVVIPDGTSEIVLSLSPEETMGLLGAGDGKEFKGVWDLEVTFPFTFPQTEGDVRTVAKGSVSCYLDITNSV